MAKVIAPGRQFLGGFLIKSLLKKAAMIKVPCGEMPLPVFCALGVIEDVLLKMVS